MESALACACRRFPCECRPPSWPTAARSPGPAGSEAPTLAIPYAQARLTWYGLLFEAGQRTSLAARIRDECVFQVHFNHFHAGRAHRCGQGRLFAAVADENHFQLSTDLPLADQPWAIGKLRYTAGELEHDTAQRRSEHLGRTI